MKKLLGYLLASLLVLTLLGTVPAVAMDKANPVDQLTGAVWMQSDQQVKNAVVFGVECAITIEYFVAQKLEEANSKASNKKTPREIVRTLSPFELGWAKAFEGVSREKIVGMVDAWYTQHPDQLQRPVFSVIWNEFIAPKLDAR